jgi:hypothetical protein
VQRNLRPVNRIAVAAAALALIGAFVAIAVSVVDARRPLPAKVSRSFATAVTAAAGRSATVTGPTCRKASVQFYDCSALVTRRRRSTAVPVAYHVWLNDDGCWDTLRRTRFLQPVALGRLRARFASLQGCFTP